MVSPCSVCNCREDSVWGGREWETFRRSKCGGLDASCGTTCWDDLWDDLWQRSMPAPDAAARHTGAGVARRQAHHERMRDERAREAAAGDAELPPEDDAVEMARAVHVPPSSFYSIILLQGSTADR